MIIVFVVFFLLLLHCHIRYIYYNIITEVWESPFSILRQTKIREPTKLKFASLIMLILIMCSCSLVEGGN